MTHNVFVGTQDWFRWRDEIKRSHRLFVREFVPPTVVLDERNELKGLIVPHREIEATEEVGNKAGPGQVLYWYGDYTGETISHGHRSWNAYDVKRNVYIVEPQSADMVSQEDLNKNPDTTLNKLADLKR